MFNPISIRSALSMALLGLSATSFQAHAADDETLRVAIHSDVASINPGVNRDANADMVVAHIAEGLVAYGDDLAIKPMLAESWTSNADHTVYEFKLRKGVKFQNGKDLTAKDIVWNFERYLKPNTAFQCVNRYNGKVDSELKSVDAVDDSTVRFSFAAPAPNFVITMATIQCTPWILSPESVDADGKFVKPIGTGPYAFSKWERGRYLDLTRFDDYVALPGDAAGLVGNKKGHVKTIQFMTVPDSSTRTNGLLSGEIDFIDEVEPTGVKDLEAKGMKVNVQQTPSWMVLQIQSTSDKLKDPQMRQAIAHAIDLKQLATAIGEGIYAPNPSVIAPNTIYSDNQASAWPAYDPAKAQELLTKAGYKGEPISLLVANRQNRVQVATIVQAFLAASGINAQLEVRDWATQLDQYRRGAYELAVFAYSARLDPLLSFQSMIGDKKADAARQWDDAKAEDLLSQVSAKSDVEERKKLFNELNTLMGEQVPILGLVNLPSITAAGPKVNDFKGWAGDTLRFWTISKEQ
ncbi:ABC transporter substrate-binding protein [Ochrobactrum sp. EDr1-4]|uniref:ABC transporter substrate-binding protein n=1 Tax=Ochrobactrum sp. EDr1-4 TaxID=3368622 RepID=UPI003BA3661E